MSTLSAGEQQRLQYELGANIIAIGAEPYIQHLRIFDVIVANLPSDPTPPTIATTSVTTPGSTAITVTSATGLLVQGRVVIDCDASAEVATIKQVAGSVITVTCQRQHTAPYPIEIESGMTMVRMKLARLAQIALEIDDASAVAGILEVDDEVKFSEGDNGKLAMLLRQQRTHRAELASMVNLTTILHSLGWREGGGMALY